jgi:hypothetical protein
MRVSNSLVAPGALALASLLLCFSGCVVKDREVVHEHQAGAGAAYDQGYKEGYYDRDHHRWWHENSWRDCDENDVHCAH